MSNNNIISTVLDSPRFESGPFIGCLDSPRFESGLKKKAEQRFLN